MAYPIEVLSNPFFILSRLLVPQNVLKINLESIIQLFL
jgi:hypothetical protein